ncbi:MAG: hypothetical protein N2595_02850 [bacterium]|nr:hypothetical protein [bacterium]
MSHAANDDDGDGSDSDAGWLREHASAADESISDFSSSFKHEAIDALLEPVVEVVPQVTGRDSGTELLWIFGFGDSAKVDRFT